MLRALSNHTRRTRILAAGLVIAAATVVYLGSQSEAGPVSPEKQLQCRGNRIVVTDVLNDNVTRETASPEELAERWSAAMAQERALAVTSTRRVSYRSANRTDIAVSEAGRTVAVLLYQHDAKLGWRLESIHECG